MFCTANYLHTQDLNERQKKKTSHFVVRLKQQKYKQTGSKKTKSSSSFTSVFVRNSRGVTCVDRTTQSKYCRVNRSLYWVHPLKWIQISLRVPSFIINETTVWKVDQTTEGQIIISYTFAD